MYVNDLDGSLGGGAPGAFMVRPDDHEPDVSAFVDTTHCANLPWHDSVAMYCEGPCMRTISVRNSPAFDSIMVVSNDQGAVHRYPTRVCGAPMLTSRPRFPY